MTLQEAIDHTWQVYQKKILEEDGAAWAVLEDSQNCHECAEEHRQLHEWLSKLKHVAVVASGYQNGIYGAENVMDAIVEILEEGDGV